MKIIGYITATIFLLIYGALMNGWALSKLWLWFIVPTFDLPPISIPAAIGMAIVVGYMSKTIKPTKPGEKTYGEALLEDFGVSTFKPLFALLIGSIVRLYL
jgi:hypothetical protein